VGEGIVLFFGCTVLFVVGRDAMHRVSTIAYTQITNIWTADLCDLMMGLIRDGVFEGERFFSVLFLLFCFFWVLESPTIVPPWRYYTDVSTALSVLMWITRIRFWCFRSRTVGEVQFPSIGGVAAARRSGWLHFGGVAAVRACRKPLPSNIILLPPSGLEFGWFDSVSQLICLNRWFMWFNDSLD